MTPLLRENALADYARISPVSLRLLGEIENQAQSKLLALLGSLTVPPSAAFSCASFKEHRKHRQTHLSSVSLQDPNQCNRVTKYGASVSVPAKVYNLYKPLPSPSNSSSRRETCRP